MASEAANVRAEPRWRRMSSADRREQLLDVTGSLIREHGLNSFTMEALTREAGVSKPLAYKYFASRLELLQALLLREYTRRYEQLERDISQAKNFVDVLRMLIASDYDRFSGRDLIRMLRSQSDVDEILQPTVEESGDKFNNLLVSTFLKEFAIDPTLARRILRMTSGASIEAAQRYKIFGGDREAHIDETVQFVLGGIRTFVDD